MQGTVDGLALHRGDLGADGERPPAEGGVARLVLALEPPPDDLGSSTPRLPVRFGVVFGVFGEQRADLGRVVGVPRLQVPVDPGPHAATLLVVHPAPPFLAGPRSQPE
jgi:hypothetical protein